VKTSALPKTVGANAMGRDIRDFYDLKRQRVLKTTKDLAR